MRDLFYFRKSIEGQQQRLERTLEEFYSLCDQVEVNLVIIFILSKLSSCFTIFTFCLLYNIVTEDKPFTQFSHQIPI
jgi:hypothetical protein